MTKKSDLKTYEDVFAANYSSKHMIHLQTPELNFIGFKARILSNKTIVKYDDVIALPRLHYVRINIGGWCKSTSLSTEG